jgi:hypothetical protein
MSRFGSLCGLGVAIAGLVAAHALALEVPPVPGVTVTTPSVPVTTAVPPPPPLPVTTALPPTPPPPPLPVTTALPPAPAPPPVTVKTPPVTVTTTTPRVTTPSPPNPVTPPITTTPNRPAATQSSSGSSGGSAAQAGGGSAPQASGPAATTSSSARYGPTRSAQPAFSNRTNRLRATPHRSKNRVTVRLAFKLSKAQRLFLIVRGPVPSCAVAGVIPIRAHRGVNKVTFAGRASGRNLRPGSYLLSLSTVRQPLTAAPTTLVKVVSKRRSVPAKPGAHKPTCAEAQASTTGQLFRLLRHEGTAAGPGATAPTQRPVSNSLPPANSDQQHDVLGVATPGAGLDSGSSADRMESLIAIGVLTLIGAILLTTVALVTRFVRGTWNP